MPSSSLYLYLKRGVLKNKRSVVKPMLTPQNKQARIDYAKFFIEPNAERVFLDMMEHGHLDKKKFYITREVTGYSLVPGEKRPPCKVKHKSHIPKVMAICPLF